ncbi:MAG: cation:proton antiporter [Candidatus Methanomethylophilus sp.]|nr:cation:proton antiporter [Methanomethylophilus sp.]MDD3233377.1 cation:proton antiporter [Methanomethylophilus sp.]
MELVSILLMLLVLFTLARIGNRVFEHFGIPGLIGEIIVGIIIANLTLTGDGSTLLDLLGVQLPGPGEDSTSTNYSILYAAAELGVIFLLFSVGLETRVSELLSVGKSALLVAVLGVILPFVCGWAYIELTQSNFHHAMFLAAAMVATSVGITARVIKDMHLMETHEAKIIIGAAVIDDVLGMVVLAIVKGTAGSASVTIGSIVEVIVMAVAFVLAMIAAAMWLVPRIYTKWEAHEKKVEAKTGKPTQGFNILVVALVACLFFAWLAETIGLAAIIGAFLAGMLFADHAWETKLNEKVETLTTAFISFFFLNVGMQVDVALISSWNVIIMAVIVIIIAVITKFVGCGLGAWLADRKIPKDSIKIIGVGMIPRGEVGIIVASIGLNLIVDGSSALSSELYAVIVLMAVATTIIAPPLLARAFRKKYPEQFTITAQDKI